MYLSIYVYFSIASLISLSKYMACYICHVIIIGHVSRYIKLTKRHFSQKHETNESMCFCFISGWMLNEMLEFDLTFSLEDHCEYSWLYFWWCWLQCCYWFLTGSRFGLKEKNWDRIPDSFMIKLDFDRRKIRFICFGRKVKKEWLNDLWREWFMERFWMLL